MIPAWAIIVALSVTVVIAAAFFVRRGKKERYAEQDVHNEVSHEELYAAYLTQLRKNLWICFQQYKKAYEKMDIPSGAMKIKKCTSVFGLEYAALDHYIWVRDGSLCFFPQWRDIALSITAPDYIHVVRTPEHYKLNGWAIPVDYIKYYTVDEENGITSVFYEDNKGENYKTVFLESGGHAFSELFPDKDYNLVKRRQYLGSYDNILDMEKMMVELRYKVEQGIITESEYEAHKDSIVRML